MIQVNPIISPKRQAYGRYVYHILDTPYSYYLKYQLNDDDYSNHQHTLQQEILFYQNHSNHVLPFQVINNAEQLFHQYHIQQSQGFGLLLTQGKALFSQKNDNIIEQCYVLSLACDAVEHLWQLGYLHGDLKAEHFIIWQNHCYLIDFEYIQAIDTTSQVLNATPHYMAPELFQGQIKNQLSELYALGIIFYEWLTGQRLRANSYYDWAILHCQQFQPQLNNQQQIFMPLLQGLLAKQASSRFQSMADVKACLEDILQKYHHY